MTLSYSEVADIVKIVDASSCDELVLELEGTRLVIKRGGTISAPAYQPTALVLETPQSTPVLAAEPVVTNIAAPVADASGASICSPMVGTFYARPTPEDAPFVEVGTKVTVGMPLCIIEVMKLFTPI
ncbi:MAG: biotin/lipoyl-containing protein, partial [Pseudomonadales bacterium]